MPKLLVFAPCERVILGQGDNSASLIGLLQEMKFEGTIIGREAPKDAGVFVKFSIFSQWCMVPGDQGKTFEQRIAIMSKNEKSVIEAVSEFAMTEKFHRIIANVQGLPFAMAGEYEVMVSLREKGSVNWSEPVASYPIQITHAIQFQAQPH